MRTKLSSTALALTLGVAGIGVGTVLGPAVATAATSQTSVTAAAGDRVQKIKDALSGLVSDGSITQAQADEVATTLDAKLPQGGHGGRGPGGKHLALDVASTALGITEAELRTQLRAGKTLAQVAEAEGVAKADLIAKLVAAGEAKLAEAVTAGRLTQAEADARKATLEARTTEQVDSPFRGKGGHGPRGGGDDAPAPSATPSASVESSSTA